MLSPVCHVLVVMLIDLFKRVANILFGSLSVKVVVVTVVVTVVVAVVVASMVVAVLTVALTRRRRLRAR